MSDDISFSATENTNQEQEAANRQPEQESGTDPIFEHGGRKYDKEALAKKLDHADSYIEQLKAELKEKEEALSTVSVEANIEEKVKELLRKTENNEQSNQQGNPPVDVEQIVEQVANTVQSQLAQKDVEKQQEQNWTEVTAKLTEAFGSETDTIVAAKAKENDISLDEAAQLARNNPKLFLKLFPELDAKKSDPKPMFGGVNSQSVANTQPKSKVSPIGQSTTKGQVNAYLERLNALTGG